MAIFEHIFENQNLAFIDAKSTQKYDLKDLMFSHFEGISNQKKLVFLYIDNDLVSIALYLSFLKTDHALALLSPSMETDRKENLEKIYEPEIVYDPFRTELKGYYSERLKNEHLKAHLFFKESHNTRKKIHGSCDLLLSTSGTTGSPKFVKLSKKNLLENAKSICAYLPINKDDITPLNLPINYSYGLSVLHSNAIKGGSIICGTPDLMQREFWILLEKYGYTSLAGVPFNYEIMSRIGFLNKEYPSLKYMTQAGGNLDKTTKQKYFEFCQQQNIELYIMYGQTEASARISFVPPNMLEEKMLSIGIPIKNGRLYLDSDSGELLYSGPNVYGGYCETREDLKNWKDIGVLRTGDLASQDSDGYFYITGRLKRIIKLHGHRINLDEIEGYLKNHFKSGSIACTGINDKNLLIAHCEKNLLEDHIKDQLFKRFRIHHKSCNIKRISEMPLTNNGKIDYKSLI